MKKRPNNVRSSNRRSTASVDSMLLPFKRPKNSKKTRLKQKIRQTRPLHRRFILHPITVFVFLCVIVFVVGWTYEAMAASYTVTAEVPAAPLTEGATITSPTDGTIVTNASALVSGTCPAGAYIKLYTNNTFAGVTFCQNDGTFSLDDDLYVGQNNLVAQDYNVTNQQGPTTPTVSVTYNVPSTPTTPSPGSTTVTSTTGNVGVSGSTSGSASVETPAVTNPPLLLTSNYVYATSAVSSGFTWTIDLEGGVPPYKVIVYWGDGSNSILIFKTDPKFQISHHYELAGYYAIKINVIDQTGNVRFITLAARIVTPNTAGNISTTDTGYSLPLVQQSKQSVFLMETKNWLWLAWPSVVIVLVMLLSFWLGERQEVRALYKQNRSH